MDRLNAIRELSNDQASPIHSQATKNEQDLEPVNNKPVTRVMFRCPRCFSGKSAYTEDKCHVELCSCGMVMNVMDMRGRNFHE